MRHWARNGDMRSFVSTAAQSHEHTSSNDARSYTAVLDQHHQPRDPRRLPATRDSAPVSSAALTRGAVTGSWRAAAEPTASATALATAAPTPDVPASPAPFTPRGFDGAAASWMTTSTEGARLAVGIG